MLLKKFLPILILLILCKAITSSVVYADPQSPDWQIKDSEEAKKILEQEYKPGEEWKRHRDLAVYHFLEKRYYQADYEIQEAIKATKDAPIKDTTFDSLFQNLAAMYRGQGKYDLSIQTLRRFIDLKKKSIELDRDWEIAISLNNIGEIYRAQKDYDKALPILLEAKSMINEQNIGYAELMQNLGMVYDGLSRRQEAESHFLKAIEVSEKGPYPNPKSVVEGKFSLALLYYRFGIFDNAQHQVTEAIPISRAAFGEDSVKSKALEALLEKIQQGKNDPKAQSNPAFQWNQYMISADTSMKSQNYDAAIIDLEKAIKIIEKAKHKSETEGLTISSLATAYFLNGNYEKAEFYFVKALAILKKYPQSKNLLIAQKGYELSKARKAQIVSPATK